MKMVNVGTVGFYKLDLNCFGVIPVCFLKNLVKLVTSSKPTSNAISLKLFSVITR